MDSFRAVIESFGGPLKFAAAVGITDSHARAMKSRNSISSDYWSEVVAAAAAHAIQGITLELLAALQAKAAGRSRQSGSVAEPGECGAVDNFLRPAPALCIAVAKRGSG